MGQLLKLPVLVSHFIEHKQHDKNTTFWQFLTHHYGGHDKDADWDTDMKLPFMQHFDALHFIVIPPGPPIILNKRANPPYADRQIAFYRDRFVSFACTRTIWQPPKFC